LTTISSTDRILSFVVVAYLAAVAILLFPLFWKHQKRKHWKYIRLLAAGLGLIGLFVPIKTHAVKLDMPAPPIADR